MTQVNAKLPYYHSRRKLELREVKRLEKLRREIEKRFSKDNAFKDKIAQEHHLSLQPSKRLKSHPLCEGGF